MHKLLISFIIGVIGPYHVEILAIHYFNAWPHFLARVLWNRVDGYFLQFFKGRRLDLSFESHLEILDVSLLTGLTDTSASGESFPAVVLDSLYEVVSKARVDQEAADRGTCPTFPRIAVDGDHHFLVLH